MSAKPREARREMLVTLFDWLHVTGDELTARARRQSEVLRSWKPFGRGCSMWAVMGRCRR